MLTERHRPKDQCRPPRSRRGVERANNTQTAQSNGLQGDEGQRRMRLPRRASVSERERHNSMVRDNSSQSFKIGGKEDGVVDP